MMHNKGWMFMNVNVFYTSPPFSISFSPWGNVETRNMFVYKYFEDIITQMHRCIIIYCNITGSFLCDILPGGYIFASIFLLEKTFCYNTEYPFFRERGNVIMYYIKDSFSDRQKIICKIHVDEILNAGALFGGIS